MTRAVRTLVARWRASLVSDPWRAAGVASVALCIACGSAAFAAVSRVLSTGDETAHVDYAYQVWLGHLPVFEHGLVFRPPVLTVPPVQVEAQHPPLFYALLAPFVGPLINGGHWVAAVQVGRAVCVVIAVACVLALAWAGSLVSTRRPAVWAISVPAVVAPFSPFMRVGGSVYSDNLATLFSVLALGVGIIAVRRGVSVRLVILAAVFAAGGMLSHATFVITLLVLVGALVLGVWMHGGGSWPSRIGRSALIGAVPLASAAIASGWFYLRNKHLTGTYTGGHSDWSEQHLQRVHRPFSDIITWRLFWNTNLQLLRQAGGTDAWLGPRLLEVAAGAGVLAGVVLLVRRHGRVEATQLAVVLVLAVQVVGTLVTEAGYVSGGGGIITRYLLPALLPFGCLLAAGILALPRLLSGLALLAYLAIAWGFFLRWAWVQPIKDGSHWSGHTANHVPWSLVTIALAGVALTALLQACAVTWARAATNGADGQPGASAPPAAPAARPSRHRAVKRPSPSRDVIPVEPVGRSAAGGAEVRPG